MKFLKVRLNDKELVFTGSRGELLAGVGGALTTVDAYRNGTPSYAHLFADGKIMRHGHALGTVDDLQIDGEIEAPEPSTEGMNRMLEAWFKLAAPEGPGLSPADASIEQQAKDGD